MLATAAVLFVIVSWAVWRWIGFVNGWLKLIITYLKFGIRKRVGTGRLQSSRVVILMMIMMMMCVVNCSLSGFSLQSPQFIFTVWPRNAMFFANGMIINHVSVWCGAISMGGGKSVYMEIKLCAEWHANLRIIFLNSNKPHFCFPAALNMIWKWLHKFNFPSNKQTKPPVLNTTKYFCGFKWKFLFRAPKNITKFNSLSIIFQKSWKVSGIQKWKPKEAKAFSPDVVDWTTKSKSYSTISRPYEHEFSGFSMKVVCCMEHGEIYYQNVFHNIFQCCRRFHRQNMKKKNCVYHSHTQPSSTISVCVCVCILISSV